MAAVPPVRVRLAGGLAHVRCSTRADGDLNADDVAPCVLERRWATLAGRPVAWAEQVHGTRVVEAERPGEQPGPADALVSATPGLALGVWVGDCAPVVLASPGGLIGVAHAGWRGLRDGVVAAVVARLRALGAHDVTALVGPCLHAECNEFGEDHLDDLAERFGPGVRATTAWGTPALDLPAGVHAALAAEGVEVVDLAMPCTGCDLDYWSHRRRGERARQGVVVWWEVAA